MTSWLRRLLAAAMTLALALVNAQVRAQAIETLAFSTAPMLVDGRLPVPNVVLAIDGGPHSARFPQAIQRSFGPRHAADGSMRLAWQVAGPCEALPDTGALCLGDNALQPLDNTRRSELAALSRGLAASGLEQRKGSSAPSLLDKARAHLHRAAPDSRSGTSRLGCRKGHVLLATPFDDAAARPGPGADLPASDFDGSAPSIRRVDTRSDDVDLELGAAVDVLLADSQSLPTQTIASLAAGMSTAEGMPSELFASRYDAARWSGEVIAGAIAGTGTGSSPWGLRDGAASPNTSASLLDQRDPATRIILTSAGTGDALAGTAFRWVQLAPWQQAALNAGDALGPQRLDYLRGERANEQSNGGRFRNRNSRQGDSVHSSLWYLPGPTEKSTVPVREPLLFVGSNGGMLHAFSASTGAEEFAYVPQGAYAGLAALTRPGHQHQYLVDGSPWTADMVDESGRRKTVLAGSMGMGGRGYFVLDVSSPIGSQGDAAAAARMVMLDTTASEDPDIGRITASPVRETAGTRQITRLNNGRWALIIGNGWGSERQQAVLLIQFLDGPRELLKLPAGDAGGNGLSAARLVDLDGDQAPDIAYAGDLQGHLWKFDLSSREPNQWKVASGGQALLLARDANGRAQPITTAPLVVPHPAGGRMVVLGTGRLLSDADRRDDATQSIYGILDADNDGLAPAGRSSLVRQAIAPEAVGTISGRRLWTASDNPAPSKGDATSRGWYVDLPVAGERVVAAPQRFDGKLVDVLSMAPSPAFRQATLPESCAPPATRNFRTTLNALDGARPRSQLYGEPGATFSASRIELRGEPFLQIKGARQERGVAFDGSEPVAPRSRLDFVARRAGWRQLQ